MPCFGDARFWTMTIESGRSRLPSGPRDGLFEVADALFAAIRSGYPTFSDVWTSGNPAAKLVNDFIDRLAARAALSDDEKQLICPTGLDRLIDLQKYPSPPWRLPPFPSMKSRCRTFFCPHQQ